MPERNERFVPVVAAELAEDLELPEDFVEADVEELAEKLRAVVVARHQAVVELDEDPGLPEGSVGAAHQAVAVLVNLAAELAENLELPEDFVEADAEELAEKLRAAVAERHQVVVELDEDPDLPEGFVEAAHQAEAVLAGPQVVRLEVVLLVEGQLAAALVAEELVVELVAEAEELAGELFVEVE